MISRAWSIYKDNESTFYDYRTNHKQNRTLAKCASVVLATLGVVLLPILSTDVLNSLITVQAILIGFSFSVMFFLVQERGASPAGVAVKPNGHEPEYSLEDQLRSEQLALLSKELFWNISYFNMVAFGSLVVAVLLMIPSIWNEVHVLFQRVGTSIPRIDMILLATSASAKWLFLILLIESSHTFMRTVGRVNFLFEQRMGRGA